MRSRNRFPRRHLALVALASGLLLGGLAQAPWPVRWSRWCALMRRPDYSALSA